MRKENIRVRGIIVDNNELVVIKRIKPDRIYYVFPGGGLEKSDKDQIQCVRREILEELGVIVDVGELKFELEENNVLSLFYECKIIDGIIGTGNGPEYSDNSRINNGEYIPMKIPINNLDKINLFPIEAKKFIIENYGFS